MKSVYVLRHAKAVRGRAGSITEDGKAAAKEHAGHLPEFAILISSDAERAKETVRLLTGKEPMVDERAGFYMAPQDKSEAILERAAKNGESFLNAALAYARENNDTEILNGMDGQAEQLVNLIKETLGKLPDNEKALVVTHDMTLIRAIDKIGEAAPSELPYLEGYIFHGNGAVEPTAGKDKR